MATLLGFFRCPTSLQFLIISLAERFEKNQNLDKSFVKQAPSWLFDYEYLGIRLYLLAAFKKAFGFLTTPV